MPWFFPLACVCLRARSLGACLHRKHAVALLPLRCSVGGRRPPPCEAGGGRAHAQPRQSPGPSCLSRLPQTHETAPPLAPAPPTHPPHPQAEGLTPEGAVQLNQYYPPFTYGIQRVNEVLLRVKE